MIWKEIVTLKYFVRTSLRLHIVKSIENPIVCSQIQIKCFTRNWKLLNQMNLIMNTAKFETFLFGQILKKQDVFY